MRRLQKGLLQFCAISVEKGHPFRKMICGSRLLPYSIDERC